MRILVSDANTSSDCSIFNITSKHASHADRDSRKTVIDKHEFQCYSNDLERQFKYKDARVDQWHAAVTML